MIKWFEKCVHLCVSLLGALAPGVFMKATEVSMGRVATRISVPDAARILRVRVADLEQCSRDGETIRGAVPPRIFQSGANARRSFGMTDFMETYKQYQANPGASK